MDVFCDERTAGHARVRFLVDTGTEITGTIRGPFCKYARTLPSTFPIRDGQAIVVDPCYWTPRLPFRYEVTVSTTTTDQVTHDQFLWGIRHCIPHRNHIFLDGKRYVLRAIEPPADQQVDLAKFRELASGLVVQTPSENLCEAASEYGVMIVAMAAVAPDACRSANRHAAVHFCRRNTNVDRCDIVSLADTEGARGTVVSMKECDLSNAHQNLDFPVFVRRQASRASIEDLRRSCDALQRDVATHGQFAGYIITVDQ